MEEYSRLNFLFPLVIDPRLDRKYVWKSLRILDQISKEKESMIDQQTTANSQRSRFFTFIIDFYYLLAVRCLLEFIRLASVNFIQILALWSMGQTTRNKEPAPIDLEKHHVNAREFIRMVSS